MQFNIKMRPRRLGLSLASLAAVAAVALPGAGGTADASAHATATIVFEHGAWADGSSWDGVVARLQRDGYTVEVPPDPLRGPSIDSAYLASYLKKVSGPVVLVGHSYGGFVISDAATGNSNVKALVYVDAYIPAQGETIHRINQRFPGSQLAPSVLSFVPSAGGVVDVYLKASEYRRILANDLPAAQAAKLAATQRPIAASALDEPAGVPAWTSIPSWDVIGTEDHAIPVAAQQFMATRAHARVTEVSASHLSMVSHPHDVATVIEEAARAVH